MAAPGELADAIRDSAGRLGINPSDLATAISYETAGTFDPWKKGPTTQWGEHRGLIQWGQPQRQKYGVTADSSIPEQMNAVTSYLKDAGVKPGHGLLDVYSAINAGRVGLYNRSDANNGGAPGTVADKVASMAGHRLRANALLGGDTSAPTPSSPVAAPQVASAPAASIAPTGAASPDAPAIDPSVLAALQAIPQQIAQDKPITPVPMQQQINMPVPPGLARARALALAMMQQPIS